MNYSVLVADDQAENIKSITALLKEMGLGKKIYAAPNGKIALELAQKFVPDLILSDWEMPVMNGIELVRSLKLIETTKDIPVIMITAVKIDPVSMNQSFDAGVHDYLKKPFNKLEFFARINATLKLQQAYLTIKKSKDEIANQSLIISNQNEELRETNKLKDTILSIVSHDVRSPLANLEGMLNIFNDADIEISDAELKEHFSLVESELSNVSSFVNDLLFWLKSQVSPQDAIKKTIQLQEVITTTLNLYKQRVESKKLKISHKFDEAATFIGDLDVTSFIIRNLIDNAIKFTNMEGQIQIDTTCENEQIKIAVTDDGQGISEKRINEFFTNKRIASQKGTHGELGTGVGLKLCKDLAENLGGGLHISSKLGEGSTFSLVLPLK